MSNCHISCPPPRISTGSVRCISFCPPRRCPTPCCPTPCCPTPCCPTSCCPTPCCPTPCYSSNVVFLDPNDIPCLPNCCPTPCYEYYYR